MPRKPRFSSRAGLAKNSCLPPRLKPIIIMLDSRTDPFTLAMFRRTSALILALISWKPCSDITTDCNLLSLPMPMLHSQIKPAAGFRKWPTTGTIYRA